MRSSEPELPRLALVTGASAGIGRALALELSRRGVGVVLVARRAARLETVADECREASCGRAPAYAVQLDLALPEAPQRLVEELARRGLAVDMLVNNAGFGQARRFHESTWEQHRAFLQVMLTGVVELTHRLVPSMIDAGRGWVLHIASLAHQLPGTPGDTLYAPTKSFLVKFAQGHAAELRGTGVRVSALCPGYTYSEFHDISGTRNEVQQLPRMMWMQPEPVARAGIDAVVRGDTTRYPGAFNRVAHGLLSVLPDDLLMTLWSRRPTRR